MRRRSSVLILVTAVIVGVVLPILSNLVTDAVPEWVRRLPWVVLVLAVLLALLPAVQAVRSAHEGRAGQPSSERAADDLAEALWRLWSHEASARLLNRPAPIRVRWSSTGRPVSAPAQAVLGDGVLPGKPVRLRLHGDAAGIATPYLRLPRRQLVVLGPPGAGKSALAILLTLKLLEHRRTDGGPVPVLLPVASWDPQREHLFAWIVRRMVEEFPALRNIDSYGAAAALRLVDAGLVVPVLDGLDEMPAILHSSAIEAIDEAAGGGRPLVVTCRSEEYEAAVRTGGRVMSTAAVVELEPVTAADAQDYLVGRLPGGRWSEVFAQVRKEPEGALALALSTPLMISLARIAYTDPAKDPGEFLDVTRFPDRDAVETHLIDALIPAAFASRPPLPGTRRGPDYHPDQVHRWLAFMATHLRWESDISWWHLHRMLSPWRRRFLGATVAGLLAAGVSAAAVAVGPQIDLELVPLVLVPIWALTAGIVGVVGPPAGPRGFTLRPTSRLAAASDIIPSTVGVGCVGSVVVWLITALPLPGVHLLPPSFVLFPFVTGLLLGLADWANSDTDALVAPSPRQVLRRDRAAALELATVCFLLIGPGFGAFDAVLVDAGSLPPSIAVWAMAASITGVVFAFLAAWPWYVVCAGWLALRGLMPSRVMTFLDVAHRRTVLRQAGSNYQFRHTRLRERLAQVDRPAGCRRAGSLSAKARRVGPWSRLTAHLLRQEMLTLMTGRLRLAVVLSEHEAQLLGNDHIGVEHLLLGLLHEGHGAAAGILDGLGVDLDRGRDTVERLVPASRVPLNDLPRFDDGSRAALLRSIAESVRLRDSTIGTRHLLLALLRKPGPVLSAVLAELDVDLDGVRSRLDAMDDRHADENLPYDAFVIRERRPPAADSSTGG